MNSGAIWALAIVVLLNTLFIAGIALALFYLNNKLNRLTESAHPLMEKPSGSLSRLEAMTAQVSERINVMLDQTGDLVQDVTRKVETTTSIAEETIAQPLISAASMMAGLSRGWDAYRAQMVKEKGNGQ